MEGEIPIRTFSLNHRIAGYLEFSIPIMNPQDVEIYLQRKTKEMRGPALKLTNLKQLYRTHERRVPIEKRWVDQCYVNASEFTDSPNFIDYRLEMSEVAQIISIK